MSTIWTKIDNQKDLGVIIDNNLKFHIHSASASKKANQILGIIKKSYNTRDALTFSTLYKLMVKPHLEYGKYNMGTILSRRYQSDSLYKCANQW